MNEQIRSLFSITPLQAFHLAFERYFLISAKLRTHFENDELLRELRIAYLWEFTAEETSIHANKIICYFSAITVLRTALEKTMTDKQRLFLCHTIAKIHYQEGVCWMQLHNELEIGLNLNKWLLENASFDYPTALPIALSGTTPIQHAITCFEKALESYASFKQSLGITDDAVFCQQSYQVYKGLHILDQFSPWARMISISYNHYLCLQEDENVIISSQHLLNGIHTRIHLHEDMPTSPSGCVISQVEALLDDVEEKIPSVKNVTTEGKTKKRSKLTKQDIVIPKWEVRITNRHQFNASFETESWLIPSFLRTRQREDLTHIYQALPICTRPMIVTKPTGTGKTAEFSAIANAAWQTGVPTIIVVPTITLVEQTYQKLIDYSQHEGMSYDSHQLARFCPTKQHMRVGPITVVTQASYVIQAQKAEQAFPTREALETHILLDSKAYLKRSVLFHPDFFSLLIVDEGHHAEGEKLFALLTRQNCVRPKVLLSASTLPGQYPQLDNACEHVITQNLRDAICTKELAPFQSLTIDFSMYSDARELTRSIRQRMKFKATNAALDEESQREIADVLCKNAGFSLTALSALKQVAEKVSATKKMMIFTDSIDHANQLAKIASAVFGEKIDAFHTRATERDVILQTFKDNKSRAIIAVGALDEGFDDPNVNLILDFSIYKSRIRRMIQRLGRALRLREDGSGALLINIKLLPQDLQLIPRDEIIGNTTEGYLGLNPEDVITPEELALTLPASLRLSSEEHISPQGAALIFPKGRKRYKLGSPPETTDVLEDEAIEIPMAAPPQAVSQFADGFFANTGSCTATATSLAAERIPNIQKAIDGLEELDVLEDIDIETLTRYFF